MSDGTDLTKDDVDDRPSRQRADSLITPPSSGKVRDNTHSSNPTIRQLTPLQPQRSVRAAEPLHTIIIDSDDESIFAPPKRPSQMRSGATFRATKPKDLTPLEISAELVAAARERRLARQSEQRKQHRIDAAETGRGSQTSRFRTIATDSDDEPDKPEHHTLIDLRTKPRRSSRIAGIPEVDYRLHGFDSLMASLAASTPKAPTTPRVRSERIANARRDGDSSSTEWRDHFAAKHVPFAPVRNAYKTPPRQIMREPPATPWAPSARNRENGFRVPAVFKSLEEFREAANAEVEIIDVKAVGKATDPVEAQAEGTLAGGAGDDDDDDGMDEWYAPASPSTISRMIYTKRQEKAKRQGKEQQKNVEESAAVKATDTWSADDLFALANDVAKSFDWVDFAARHEKTCDEVADVLEQVVTRPLAELARAMDSKSGGAEV